MPRVIFFPQSNTCIVYFLDLKTRLDLKVSQYPWSHAVAVTSRSTKYIPYAGSTSKNLLGPKRPYEAFCSLCRPKSLLVTPSRGARHMNDRDPPWSSCPSSVFVVEEGILPVGSHWWRWNIARNPARASVSLGTQESSLLQERLRASHGTVKNTGPIVAQPAQSWFREDDHVDKA
jgi:hypothetical protein